MQSMFIVSLNGKFNRHPCIYKALAGNHTGHAMHEAPVFFESFLFPEVVLTAIDETEAISTMEKPAASTFIDF